MCYPATAAAANLLNTPISCQSSSSTRMRTADDCPLPPQINRYTDLELHDIEQHGEDRQDLPHFPQLLERPSSPDDDDTRFPRRLLQLQQRKRSFTEYQQSLETNKTLYNENTIDLSSESMTTLSFKSLSLSTTPKYLSPKKKSLPFNDEMMTTEQPTMKRRRRSGLLDEYSHATLSVEIDDLRLSHPRAA